MTFPSTRRTASRMRNKKEDVDTSKKPIPRLVFVFFTSPNYFYLKVCANWKQNQTKKMNNHSKSFSCHYLSYQIVWTFNFICYWKMYQPTARNVKDRLMLTADYDYISSYKLPNVKERLL